MKSIGDLFKSPPDQWGLRGDPFLWRDLARVFRPVPLPDSEITLSSMLEAAFFAMTAKSITTSEEMVFVDRYAHGGMSSGHIYPKFWREQGFPLIITRFTLSQDQLI